MCYSVTQELSLVNLSWMLMTSTVHSSISPEFMTLIGPISSPNRANTRKWSYPRARDFLLPPSQQSAPGLGVSVRHPTHLGMASGRSDCQLFLLFHRTFDGFSCWICFWLWYFTWFSTYAWAIDTKALVWGWCPIELESYLVRREVFF